MLIRRLLLATLLALLATLAGCGQGGRPMPRATGGMLDLADWNFQRDGIVALDGEWLFEWNRFAPPGEAPAGQPMAVPGSWNDLPLPGGGTASAHGHGTYRLRVTCRDASALAINLPMQHSAARWFVNGVEVAHQGQPAARAADARPAQTQQVLHLQGVACPMDIVVHMSNHDVRRGGLMRGLDLGDAVQLHARRELALARDLFTMGALAVMGVLPLIFFLFRPRDRSPLYFGLFCFSFVLVLGFSGTRGVQSLFGLVTWDPWLRTVFTGWCGVPLMFLLFVRALFPQAVHRRIVPAVVAYSILVLGVVMTTPSAIFTWLIAPTQVVALLLACYLGVTLAREWRRGRRSAGLLLAGLAALAATATHDALSFPYLSRLALAPIGVLAFALAPGILLARRFSRVLVAEERIAIEQRERADLLVRSTKAGVVDWDAIGNVTRYSERYREMLGYPLEQDAPLPPFAQQVHPDDRAMVQASFRAQLNDRSVRSGVRMGEPRDYRLLRADGSDLWIHAEAVAVCGSDGRTLRYICSFIDISDSKQHEAEMREQLRYIDHQQKRLDLVVRGALVGIVDWDGVTHETYYSPRFREIRGCAPDADTRDWPDYFRVMIHPDDRERITRRWVAFIKGRGPEGPFGDFYAPEEYRLLKGDGDYVWVQVSGMAVRDAQGFVTRWIAAVIDITQRREQEEALRENLRLREEVERIGRHDIKTPLNSIIAVPRLLREERALSADEDELLGIVERAGYRILSMVNLSLDLYKMENGSYIFRPDAVDLMDLLDKVMSDLRTHAASKHVTLRVRAGAQPAYAWAEELLCYSLLANLLKNAVEASPDRAEVTVMLERDDAAGTVLLRIHNQGAVPEAVRPHFFTKYATAGKASGTGLGTYSARLMARVQDGELDMATSDAEGTTITARLRAAPVGIIPATVRHAEERRARRVDAPSALPALRVLLVDDDEYNLLIVRRFLPTPPLAVDTAINGRAALEKVLRDAPDVIIMDLDMPVMGGLEAIGRVRAHEVRSGLPRCLAVALSSHDDETTRSTALAAGFDHYLAKPVTREVVQETLRLLAGRRPAARRVPSPAPIVTRPAASQQDLVLVDPDIWPTIPGFLASRRALVDEMRTAMAAGDRAALRSAAHRLTGSLALYGFHWAADHSKRIEVQAEQLDAPTFDIMARELAHHLDTVDTAPAP